jgi:8-oxo-dGTP pyrophosphatase MutT (NUDIX family)
VLREAETVQVLMTQRHANLSFMGGMWVFPGGALSPSDASDDALNLIHRPEAFSSGPGHAAPRMPGIGHCRMP